MTAREWLDQVVEERDLDLLLADDFDDAIVGVAQQFDRTFVVYDEARVLARLEAMGLDADEAREYYEFNVLGAYVGESTPAFLERPPEAPDVH